MATDINVVKSFFQVDVTGPGVTLSAQKKFIKRLNRKVGDPFLPPGITAVAKQILVSWASCSHQTGLLGIGGTSRFIIVFKRAKMTVEGVKSAFKRITNCSNSSRVTVRWFGDDAENKLIAGSAEMYPATGGFVNQAIHYHRTVVAEWGDPGTFMETDGSDPTQNLSPTGYPCLAAYEDRGVGQMGGYVERSTGQLWLQDNFVHFDDRPYLTNEQLISADNPTRGMASATVYNAYQQNVQQECIDLINSIQPSFLAFARAVRPTRDDAELIEYLAKVAVDWKRDMGTDGMVLDVTVEPRSNHNSPKWSTLGEIVLPGEQTFTIGPTDSSQSV